MDRSATYTCDERINVETFRFLVCTTFIKFGRWLKGNDDVLKLTGKNRQITLPIDRAFVSPALKLLASVARLHFPLTTISLVGHLLYAEKWKYFFVVRLWEPRSITPY